MTPSRSIATAAWVGLAACTHAADAPTDEGGSAGSEGPFVPEPSWQRWEVRADGFDVPAAETTYACFGVSFELGSLADIVAFEPIIDGAFVHHMILARADHPIDLIEPCYPAPPDATMLWGWGPGGGPLFVPDVAGFLVGEDGPTVHFVVQIHYSNPAVLEAHVDSSGIALYTTTELRPNRAAVWGLGDVHELLIPPGWPSWETIHYCGPESTAMVLSEPVQVFGSWLHAHQLGRALWTEQQRGGVTIGELGRHDPYVFDNQHFEPLDAVVEPGNALFTHCVYDSSARTEPTYGGGATDDEMCLNYLLYWPHQPLLEFCNE